MPNHYVKIFGSDMGCKEVQIKQSSVLIGRSRSCDIVLDHETVSRTHALIGKKGEKCMIMDQNSSAGVFVNGERINNHILKPGDNIQIASYTLEYKVEEEDFINPDSPELKASKLLPEQCRLLPSSIDVQYRSIGHSPSDLFGPGDTLPVGEGGILIPTRDLPPDDMILEVKMIWPNKRHKNFLGEVLGVLQEKGHYMLCIKLHNVAPQAFDKIINDAEVHRGPWVIQSDDPRVAQSDYYNKL